MSFVFVIGVEFSFLGTSIRFVRVVQPLLDSDPGKHRRAQSIGNRCVSEDRIPWGGTNEKESNRRGPKDESDDGAN